MKMTDDDYLRVYRAWSGSPAHDDDERQAAIGVVSAAVGGDLDRATAVMVRHGWGVQGESITGSIQAEPLYAALRATACRLGYPVAGDDVAQEIQSAGHASATHPVEPAASDAAALRDENARLRLALADAIRRPMGVVPASAEGLVTDADLVAAESRRVTAGHATRGS